MRILHTESTWRAVRTWLGDQPSDWLHMALIFTGRAVPLGTDHATLVDCVVDAIEYHATCSEDGEELFVDRHGSYRVPVVITE